jgi:DNA-binding response OmpR family regulator
MLTNATHTDLPELPPIVLLVEEDATAVESYEKYFSSQGVWIANALTPEEGLTAIDDLRPDLVVCELEFHGQPDGARLVADLKGRRETSNIPVILLARRDAPEVPADTRWCADLFLQKPVPPADLLVNIRRLLESSSALRARGQRALAEARKLRGKSHALLERSAVVSAQLEDTGSRRCPICRNGLDWIERGQLDGQEFDYYRWCASGCGLYCFNRTRRSWIKLA